MSRSLGIYIENNLIKYAKVSKEHDNIKIEAYGVRTFENLSEEIKKIMEETYSFNTPVSINVSNEKYLYFDIFALLNKKDIQRTAVTEFEAYCEEKNYNKNAFEMRYALVSNLDDKDKIKAIDIIVNKIELNRQIQLFELYKLTKVLPLPIMIADIAEIDKKENALIVNMEETTTITTIVEQKIYDLKTLETGSRDILEKINKMENSYSKAYEICKNTTIYTADIENSTDDQPYLQYVIPTVYAIREQVQELILNSSVKFDKIYLTGTLANINNIDLYFQEIFTNGECKILRPKFVTDNLIKIDIKDYIEVNSAIALAVNGLGEGNQSLNFKKMSVSEKMSQMMKIETKSQSKENKTSIFSTDSNMTKEMDNTEVWLMRAMVAIILLIIIFSIFSKLIFNQMVEKENQINSSMIYQKEQISKITTESDSIDNKTKKYKELIDKLDEENNRISDIAARKNSIPNLLNQIMYVIPEEVQITSIDNPINKNIVIKATASKYEQLGYFIAKLKTKEILKNVVSSSGYKNEKTITVTIEGELP